MIIKFRESKTVLDVYQAKNGCIYISLGDKQLFLEKEQLFLVETCLYDIEDFDVEAYRRFYAW